MKIRTILSDNGREYCGRFDRHLYQLFLQPKDVEHRIHEGRETLSRTASSNVSIVPFLRNISGSRAATWYEISDETQNDLDVYSETHNQRRPHRGLQGRDPQQRTRKPSVRKEMKKAAKDLTSVKLGVR